MTFFSVHIRRFLFICLDMSITEYIFDKICQKNERKKLPDSIFT